MTELKLVPVGDLASEPPPTNERLAAELARTAAKCAENGRIDSATWRLADALYLLSNKGDSLPGIHMPTGRGAQLSTPANNGHN